MTTIKLFLLSCGLLLVGVEGLRGVQQQQGNQWNLNGTASNYNNRHYHHAHHQHQYNSHHHGNFVGGPSHSHWNRRPSSSSSSSSWRHQHFVEELNKRVVLNFYQEFFGDKNIAAADKYIDPLKYIQHNPHVADGLQSLKEAAVAWFEGVPKETVDIKRCGADDDLVWVHIKTTMDDGKVGACIDIFRLENGKIVEHWDVQQAMPDSSANDHPLF